jgi:hypothetical protein
VDGTLLEACAGLKSFKRSDGGEQLPVDDAGNPTVDERGVAPPDLVAVLSYDEKPGIQALENTAPDLPPMPARHSAVVPGP